MVWVAPSIMASAPTRPTRFLALVLVGLAVLLVGLAVVNPFGALPGMADHDRDGDQVTLRFDGGDRYFWLPSTPEPPIHASDLLGELPGRQALVQRANYQDTQRQTFDEDHAVGADNADFALHPDFLYELRGLQDDAEFQYTDQGESTGRSFANDIRDNSHTVLRRIWVQLLSLPTIVWDDVRHVGDDVAELFAEGSPDQGARGLVSAVRAHWELFAGLLLLFLLAPLLGAGPLAIGLVGALILVSGGSTPFYLLAALCAALGILLDADGPRHALGTLGLKTAVGAGALTYEYPRATQGILVYLVGAGLSVVLAWFGHVQLLAAVMLVTGLAAVWLMARPGDENRAGRNPLTGLHVVPGVLIAVLGLLNGTVLLHVGFEGFGMAFLLVATIVGYQVVLRHLRLQWRLHREYLHHVGEGETPGKSLEQRAAGRLSRYVTGMARWTKLAYTAILVFLYLGIAAVARQDWLAFAAHLLVGILALVGTWLLGRRISERHLEDSE